MGKKKIKEPYIGKDCFEYLEEGVIGKLNYPKKTMKKFKRIGGLNADLLRKFLNKLSKDKDCTIGIYLTKRTKKLAPIHSNGICLAPMWCDDKDSKARQDEEEF